MPFIAFTKLWGFRDPSRVYTSSDPSWAYARTPASGDNQHGLYYPWKRNDDKHLGAKLYTVTCCQSESTSRLPKTDITTVKNTYVLCQPCNAETDAALSNGTSPNNERSPATLSLRREDYLVPQDTRRDPLHFGQSSQGLPLEYSNCTTDISEFHAPIYTTTYRALHEQYCMYTSY